MYSQIFRKQVPEDIIWNLLEKICTYNKDHFLTVSCIVQVRKIP